MKQLNRKKTAKWMSEQIGKNACSVSRWCINGAQSDLDTLFHMAEILTVDVRKLPNVEKKIFN